MILYSHSTATNVKICVRMQLRAQKTLNSGAVLPTFVHSLSSINTRCTKDRRP